jgi:hypothetical protein
LSFTQRPLTVGVCAKLLTRHEKAGPDQTPASRLMECPKAAHGELAGEFLGIAVAILAGRTPSRGNRRPPLSSPIARRGNPARSGHSCVWRTLRLRWFRSQKSPKTGVICCNEADGVYAEEEVRSGHYWTRFPEPKGEWMQVPDDVVIKDPNRHGVPVVWWYYEMNPVNGKRELKIRCYAVGGGV